MTRDEAITALTTVLLNLDSAQRTEITLVLRDFADAITPTASGVKQNPTRDFVMSRLAKLHPGCGRHHQWTWEPLYNTMDTDNEIICGCGQRIIITKTEWLDHTFGPATENKVFTGPTRRTITRKCADCDLGIDVIRDSHYAGNDGTYYCERHATMHPEVLNPTTFTMHKATS